ncbi:MAG TPA: AAA family ATPase [Streptosporangiaceae bacterium]|nr:AAA family ATPase [Streptosporangiaceae bacterium]
MTSVPELDQDRDMGGLAGLAGLEAVSEQLAGPIAVLRAEQARRQAGAAVTRAAWKNLIFTGGAGAGKTRAAKAVARIYAGLGLLSGDLREIAAADLVGTTLQETGALVGEMARRASGDLLMINDAHGWYGLPDHGRHVLRCLYKELTVSRDHSPNHSSGLAVILAGPEGPLRDMLRASPALAARFPAVINFPGYTAAQLAAIFAALASEAGFTLTPGAARKAAAVLAEAGHGAGNARLAVRLLDHAAVSQARRVTTILQPSDPATLSAIDAADIPAHVHAHDPPVDDWPGQYL